MKLRKAARGTTKAEGEQIAKWFPAYKDKFHYQNTIKGKGIMECLKRGGKVVAANSKQNPKVTKQERTWKELLK